MTSKTLHISDELSLAADAVTQTIVVYGMKGQGKTVLGAVICEELARAGHKFAFLDPIGPGYGLRYARDGKGKGLDILVLGGRHGDLPIEPTGGAVVADLVVNHSVNTVIDISRRADGKMWGAGEKIRFTADYCERLYERQGEKCFPIMQLIDEAGRFCPQQIPHNSPQIARCVGAIEQLTELGRNVGVGVVLITQRSARMNKSVSELAECMIAFRTIGPNSVGAITDWLGEHVPKDKQREMVEKLRTLPKGSALIVSPGWLEFEGVVKLRMRDTFDSSATPTADRKLVAAAKLDDKALEKYRTLMAETIEKAKADDPREAKKKIVELEKRVAELTKEIDKPKAAAKPETSLIEVFALGTNERKSLDRVAAAIERAGSVIDAGVLVIQERKSDLAGIRGVLDKLLATKKEPIAPKPQPMTTQPQARQAARQISEPSPVAQSRAVQNGDDKLSQCAREILKVLDQFRGDGCDMRKLLLLTGYREQGSFLSTLTDLRGRGLIIGQNRERMFITPAGSALGPFPALPTGDELKSFWLNHRSFDQCAKNILKVVLGHPDGLTIDEIAERTNYKIQGTFLSCLTDLRTAGVIVGQNRERMKPSETLLE